MCLLKLKTSKFKPKIIDFYKNTIYIYCLRKIINDIYC